MKTQGNGNRPEQNQSPLRRLDAYVGRTFSVVPEDGGGYTLTNRITGKKYPITHEQAIIQVEAALTGMTPYC